MPGNASAPCLAESWTASPDGLTYEFVLRKNTRFHNGETVTAETVLEAISDEKVTRLGPGHFVTWVTTYRAGDGDPVGRQRFRILKFKPGQPGS